MHGEASPAYVCQHLLDGLRARDIRSIGFYEAGSEPGEEDDCGWCRACEGMRLAEGGWNDKSEGFAQIKLVCSGCFADMRDLANTPLS